MSFSDRIRPLALLLLLAPWPWLAADAATADTAAAETSATTGPVETSPEDPRRADIRLALHTNQAGGSTHARGWSGGRVGIGESVRVIVGAGYFSYPGREPSCMSFANGMPFDALRQTLGRQAAVWELSATLEAIDQEAMTLSFAWRRMENPTGEGPRQVAGASERKVVLRHAEHRVIDFRRFDPVDAVEPCHADGILVRFEARYRGRPEAHLPVDHRVWLIERIHDIEKVSPAITLSGLQGEALSFRFDTVPLALGLATAEGEPAHLVGRVSGTLTSWWEGEKLLLEVVDAQAEQRLLVPGGGAARFGSAAGAQRFEARVGEVIDIEIPASRASVSLELGDLEAAGSLPRGVELDGEILKLTSSELFEGRQVALRLEVLPSD